MTLEGPQQDGTPAQQRNTVSTLSNNFKNPHQMAKLTLELSNDGIHSPLQHKNSTCFPNEVIHWYFDHPPSSYLNNLKGVILSFLSAKPLFFSQLNGGASQHFMGCFALAYRSQQNDFADLSKVWVFHIPANVCPTLFVLSSSLLKTLV